MCVVRIKSGQDEYSLSWKTNFCSLFGCSFCIIPLILDRKVHVGELAAAEFFLVVFWTPKPTAKNKHPKLFA